MRFRDFLNRSDSVRGLENDIKKIRARLWQKYSGSALEAYVASHSVRKLHLGSGPIGLPGWFNTDLSPQTDSVVYLDARKPFVIDDETFDYVFSEHMIEHISRSAGLFMLRECWRVLKPGGTIRVATPDLAVVLGLYSDSRGR
jgi:predicted SAM-dependent methyltransferase